jgi:cytochrome c-type biogenesis protein CcmH
VTRAAAVLFVVGAASAATLFVVGAASAATSDEERYRALIAELRCLVCQNQSIAESNAPLAEDLRQQVRVQIAAGKTDEEIIEFLTERYGDFVRYRPAFKGRTLLLWLGPFALLALAGGIAAMFVRRSRAAAVAPPSADAQRLAQVLDQEDKAG